MDQHLPPPCGRPVQAGKEPLPVSRIEVSDRTRKLFMVLHGAYGTAFTAKFAAGVLNERGEDKGTRAAQLVWDAELAHYPDEVVELAARRIQRECPERAPGLPQFQRLCDALVPRKTYAQEHGLLALPAPVRAPLAPVRAFEPMNDGRDWARALRARHEAGHPLTAFQVKTYQDVLDGAGDGGRS